MQSENLTDTTNLCTSIEKLTLGFKHEQPLVSSYNPSDALRWMDQSNLIGRNERKQQGKMSKTCQIKQFSIYLRIQCSDEPNLQILENILVTQKGFQVSHRDQEAF
mmetsp:Transcript_25198/g.55300  ORF Transcript_25198/g.55300 Transcript_25198/m.55300 type:complete len:106 (+) Transcript_25198:1744-2061(+)